MRLPYDDRMSSLAEILKLRFASHGAGELDATVHFNWPSGGCTLGIHDGALTVYSDAAAPDPELVLFFSDETLAIDIFKGEKNPVDAFMAGDFRSNGYILWVFQTLAAFSNPLPPDIEK